MEHTRREEVAFALAAARAWHERGDKPPRCGEMERPGNPRRGEIERARSARE